MKQLIDVLEEMKLPYEQGMIDQFQRYMELILEWNEKVNLTSITDQVEFIIKHYVDSVVICECTQFQEAKKIIDIGTGAGFPGIPLAILYPEKEFLLLDSLNKRIKIIQELAAEIGLQNVSFCHGRAEEFAHKKEYREHFDLCVSRAVANLAVLSEYCLPFVRLGGWFAAYKSAAADDEIESSKKAVTMLGGEMKDNYRPQTKGFDLDHRIQMIYKNKKTLAKYPRKAGTPAKEPLK
ncbi:16S rRNA (guanine(527)-N(7))-methyltransferase RsmG [Anoxybacterium hadale]|uniref:16S rRNA (Guanine(527)-N(7))-methyltransferase RsmG n=1 Tax=Anoxybacterium hadale TaxID=3408580 RepID=A0ACD1AF26_9FIRM|nr:16S rRNA (guanine(527)-N(7))-methyltransferase RsmG [Clostridiales bacterium]